MHHICQPVETNLLNDGALKAVCVQLLAPAGKSDNGEEVLLNFSLLHSC